MEINDPDQPRRFSDLELQKLKQSVASLSDRTAQADDKLRELHVRLGEHIRDEESYRDKEDDRLDRFESALADVRAEIIKHLEDVGPLVRAFKDSQGTARVIKWFGAVAASIVGLWGSLHLIGEYLT